MITICIRARVDADQFALALLVEELTRELRALDVPDDQVRAGEGIVRQGNIWVVSIVTSVAGAATYDVVKMLVSRLRPLLVDLVRRRDWHGGEPFITVDAEDDDGHTSHWNYGSE